jgi:hypothetical protein
MEDGDCPTVAQQIENLAIGEFDRHGGFIRSAVE